MSNHTLTSLPPELRLQIYPYLLSSTHCKHEDPAFPSNEPFESDLDPADAHVPQVFTFHPSILRVCRLLHNEASAYLAHANTLLRIVTPWPNSAYRIAGHGLVPLVAVHDIARRYKDPAMEIRVSMPSALERGDYNYPQDECHMLIALDDLPLFTCFWWFSSLSFHMLNPQLCLKLLLSDKRTFSLKQQEKLLLPFTRVRKLAEFDVVGPADEALLTRLKEGMQEPLPTPESCLESCTRLKDEGNLLLKEGDFTAAIEKYNAAHAAIFVIVDGRRRDVWGEDHFKRYCTSGPYMGQMGIMVAMILRVKLVANTMQAYLKLENWAEARFWGERSIRLMGMYMEDSPEDARPDFLGGPEIGKIYYRTGVAARAVGDVEESREYFRVAERWLPNDEIVRKAAMEGRPRLL